MKYCCVCTSNSQDKSLRFHKIPDLPHLQDLREQWIHAILKHKKVKFTPYSLVCSLHFNENDYFIGKTNKKHLKLYSVPSLFPKRSAVNTPNFTDPTVSIETVYLNHPKHLLESANSKPTTETPAPYILLSTLPAIINISDLAQLQTTAPKDNFQDYRYETLQTEEGKHLWTSAMKEIAKQENLIKNLLSEQQRLQKLVQNLERKTKFSRILQVNNCFCFRRYQNEYNLNN